MSDNEHQQQLDLFPFIPLATYERFAMLSGLTSDAVRGMADRGHLPTKKVGKRRLINLLRLVQDCAED